MEYSRSIKIGVLKKVLPPESKSIRGTSRQFGISEQTIRNWIKQKKDGIFDTVQGDKSLRYLSSKEKYQLLMESARIPEEKLGEFLRERGLHSEHLKLWDQELREMVTKKEDKKDKKLRELIKRNKELEKELTRKEKALAETAALLVLKKKLEILLGEDGDD
jgi:transposase-like protein